MKTVTVKEFRSRMKDHLQEIEENQNILMLSGPKKKEFVVLTLELFNAMEETAHLLSTPANATRLRNSIAQVKAGKIFVKEPSAVAKESKVIYKKAAKKTTLKKSTAKKRKEKSNDLAIPFFTLK